MRKICDKYASFFLYIGGLKLPKMNKNELIFYYIGGCKKANLSKFKQKKYREI